MPVCYAGFTFSGGWAKNPSLARHNKAALLKAYLMVADPVGNPEALLSIA